MTKRRHLRTPVADLPIVERDLPGGGSPRRSTSHRNRRAAVGAVGIMVVLTLLVLASMASGLDGINGQATSSAGGPGDVSVPEVNAEAPPSATVDDAPSSTPIQAVKIDPGPGTPSSTTCPYSDAGNGNPIKARIGTTFTDSLDNTWLVEPDCTLTFVRGPTNTDDTCPYSDAGNGNPIRARIGTTFTDSLDNTWLVEPDCTLSFISGPPGPTDQESEGNDPAESGETEPDGPETGDADPGESETTGVTDSEPDDPSPADGSVESTDSVDAGTGVASEIELADPVETE